MPGRRFESGRAVSFYVNPAMRVLVFSAKTHGSEDVKAIITSISTLTEEATFVANPEGITFRGMDPSHVALVDVNWPNSAFEQYDCKDEVKFGVRIEELAKIIKRADKKDDIEIKIDDNVLLLTVGRSKKYKIRLIESSTNNTPLPKIPYDSKIVLKYGKFEKILGDVNVVSEYITTYAEGSKCSFAGKGDSGEVVIEVDADETEEISTKNPGEGTYSLEYLTPMVKAVGGAGGRVVCEFSEAKPLRVEFPIAGTGRIHFYLAPKVKA